MKLLTKFAIRFFWVFAASCLMVQSIAFSSTVPAFATAVQGYDVTGYFTENKPVKGNGDHVVIIDGVYYLFSSEKSKALFKANPDKYIPQYGGWCAFATSIGKKIASDPLAWKIVDGKLYLNLNERVQKIWAKDIPGYIKKADANWLKIKDINPDDL
ncbi:YHS domain-containing (seleno)protein [Legionella sp. CNM-4043-24]|uniref:YHS domain-containing (seleno)protein n=1 Tax=Legionella sp. CNM-4043-24 TaxID=3421646 RepID=UPI00403A8C83